MAHFLIAQEEHKTAQDKAEGMGRVVSLYRKACAEFERAKPVVGLCTSNYQENFNNKYAEAQAQRDKAINQNKTIYFEKEPALDTIKSPDLQNFVKMESSMDNINQKLQIEEKLRHIVPPQVRAMQMEINKRIQEIVSQ